MDWLVYLILFVLSSVFYISIGAGFLEYHVWLFKPSLDEFRRFDKRLHFPFHFFRLKDEEQQDYLNRVNPSKAMMARFIGTAIPSFFLWRTLFEAPSNATDLWGTVLITLPLLIMWKFGRGLKNYAEVVKM